MTLRIGTRGSKLAQAQAGLIAAALGVSSELRVVRTHGDASDRPISELGDGAFVTAIEEALRRGEVDVAVHSLKDLPTEERTDLVVAAIPEREDPRDVLVTRDGADLAGLARGAVIGTSSPRRAAFIQALRPDLQTREIRGNVDTRIRKVREGEYDGVVLALAGLRRLGIDVASAHVLDPADCPPAPGQGALAVQCRAADERTRELVASLDHADTRRAVTAERALLRALGASCLLALGALGTSRDGSVHLEAALATSHGIRRARGDGTDPLALAVRLASQLEAVVHA